MSSAIVFLDHETGQVVSRLLDPETGRPVVEFGMDPETAREFAYALTTTSYQTPEAPGDEIS